MNIMLDVINKDTGEMRGGIKTNTGLLREQREALLTSIDDSGDFAEYSSESEIRKMREQHIRLLDGIVALIDATLDLAEEDVNP